MASLMQATNRGWFKSTFKNMLIEYGVIGSVALLLVLILLPSDDDAGDFSSHEPGTAHVRHTDSAFMSTVHHMEGQCGRFPVMRARPNVQQLEGTDKVVLVTGAAGFIGSHTARCVQRSFNAQPSIQLTSLSLLQVLPGSRHEGNCCG